jgi:hypothetical protein
MKGRVVCAEEHNDGLRYLLLVTLLAACPSVCCYCVKSGEANGGVCYFPRWTIYILLLNLLHLMDFTASSCNGSRCLS